MFTSMNVSKEEIMAALRKAGVAKAVIEYSGSGDSGQVDSVVFFDRNGDGVDTSAKIILDTKVDSPPKDGETAWTTRVEKREFAIDQAVERYAYDCLGAKVPGWEDNDGGQGRITIFVDDDLVVMEHQENVVETIDCSWEI